MILGTPSSELGFRPLFHKNPVISKNPYLAFEPGKIDTEFL